MKGFHQLFFSQCTDTKLFRLLCSQRTFRIQTCSTWIYLSSHIYWWRLFFKSFFLHYYMYCNEVCFDYWYIVQPNFNARVEPLSCLHSNSALIDGAKYAPVVYGDHVVKKVLNNFGWDRVVTKSSLTICCVINRVLYRYMTTTVSTRVIQYVSGGLWNHMARLLEYVYHNNIILDVVNSTVKSDDLLNLEPIRSMTLHRLQRYNGGFRRSLGTWSLLRTNPKSRNKRSQQP